MPSDREEFLERIKKLPPDLTDAIFSEDIAETLLSIGKKYNLLLDKVGKLSEATNDVILGVLHPKEYIAELERNLGIDRETAKKIAQEVNTEIFAKIRESLRKVHKIEDVAPVFASDKKIPFADLKPIAPISQQPPTFKSSVSTPPVAPKPSVSGPAPFIRPFQGGGIKVEVQKETAMPEVKMNGDLEKEVESLLKAAGETKSKDEPKKFWQSSGVTSVKPEEKPETLIDVKIKAVEDETAPPKMSPFSSKMQDGIFRSGPAEERKVVEEKSLESAPLGEARGSREQDKPAVPRYGFNDPYREAPDEKERVGLPRAG